MYTENGQNVSIITFQEAASYQANWLAELQCKPVVKVALYVGQVIFRVLLVPL